jgi:hypothetical protein
LWSQLKPKQKSLKFPWRVSGEHGNYAEYKQYPESDNGHKLFLPLVFRRALRTAAEWAGVSVNMAEVADILAERTFADSVGKTAAIVLFVFGYGLRV